MADHALITERVRVSAQNMGQLYRCLNKVQQISVCAVKPVMNTKTVNSETVNTKPGTGQPEASERVIGQFLLSLEGPAEYFSRLRRLLNEDVVSWL